MENKEISFTQREREAFKKLFDYFFREFFLNENLVVSTGQMTKEDYRKALNDVFELVFSSFKEVSSLNEKAVKFIETAFQDRNSDDFVALDGILTCIVEFMLFLSLIDPTFFQKLNSIAEKRAQALMQNKLN